MNYLMAPHRSRSVAALATPRLTPTAVAHFAGASLVLAMLFGIGFWTARWADSLLVGVVAANIAFVAMASLFPINPVSRQR